MGFLKKVGKKITGAPESKTDEIMDKRAELKKTIAKNLKSIGFNKAEVDEVLDILNKSEEEIQIKKDSLIGTNINTENTVEIMDKVFREIREIELRTSIEMKEKIAEIKAKKDNK